MAAGQALVALVYGSLAARVPLSGYSYQWASRLANVHIGWWLGWMSFAFLSIVTVSVDYGLIQVAFQPLIGETYTATSAALETLVVLAVQAALIIWSTRITTRVNNTAVATEVIGIVGLTLLLIVVAAIRHKGHWSNLGSSGVVPAAGYYSWLGPFMLATLLGAYTIVGFESASNLAEETEQPHKVIPRAMLRAVLLSGAVGMAFLIALSYATNSIKAASTSGAAGRVHRAGCPRRRGAEDLPYLRLRLDLRLRPGDHGDQRPADLLDGQGQAAAGVPALAAGTQGDRRAVLGDRAGGGHRRDHHARAAHPHSALITLFTASTIMPALLYASTVLLYVFAGRRRRGSGAPATLGRFEIPIVAGALIWLAYELIVLIGPERVPGRAVLRARRARRRPGVLRGAVADRAGRDADRGRRARRRRARGGRGDRRFSGRSACVNILAIDQGTSATKALLVGPGQQVLGTGEVPVRLPRGR